MTTLACTQAGCGFTTWHPMPEAGPELAGHLASTHLKDDAAVQVNLDWALHRARKEEEQKT